MCSRLFHLSAAEAHLYRRMHSALRDHILHYENTFCTTRTHSTLREHILHSKNTFTQFFFFVQSSLLSALVRQRRMKGKDTFSRRSSTSTVLSMDFRRAKSNAVSTLTYSVCVCVCVCVCKRAKSKAVSTLTYCVCVCVCVCARARERV